MSHGEPPMLEMLLSLRAANRVEILHVGWFPT
jgi:hypothetical protein